MNQKRAVPLAEQGEAEIVAPAGENGGLTPDSAAEAGLPTEDASRYCPVCSHRLESRRCKLICTVCGYYMSCADYY